MTNGGVRLIDTHVHHWDPGNSEWYPYLRTDPDAEELGLGDVSAMKRYYDQATYATDSASWDVAAYVHVSAATGPRTWVAETSWLTRLNAEHGVPHAVIGAVDGRCPLNEIEADLDEQAQSPLFRGVRVMTGMDHVSQTSKAILNMLAERGSRYELVAHPGDAPAVIAALSEVPDLACVLEHSGWPHSPDDFTAWQADIDSYARELPHLLCKVSGLPMTLRKTDRETLAPWVEHMLGAFGPERCVLGSNFPVDAMYGTFDQLMGSYLGCLSGLPEDQRDAVLCENARQFYALS